jgi:NAD(P)H-dependent FMN reductase
VRKGYSPEVFRLTLSAAAIGILRQPLAVSNHCNLVKTPKILAFAGSTRDQSFNKRLVRIAADGARAAGVETTLIDLRDYPLPIFDEDLEAEQGMPAHAAKLKELFVSHDGLLIASPEYNSSLTAVLKNVIDWVSRSSEGEPPLTAFSGKAAAILSASPGALGGLRGLVHLRAILSNLNVIVLPEQTAVGSAHDQFDSEGNLKDPRQVDKIQGIGKRLAAFVKKHHAA